MTSSESLPSGFVYLNDFIPDIQVSLRYGTDENFAGTVIDGYLSNVSIISEKAAFALKKVQESLKELGYELVIYDSYRPQKSVNHFMKWSSDSDDPQTKKESYYPRTDKKDSFALGYIAKRSGHTRGSTVDLTIIEHGKRVLHPLIPKKRILKDNFSILYLDDGTVDMGSSFDLFDEASATETMLVEQEHRERRLMFKNIMETAGFKNYQREWWHYTLVNEPFPDTYFDFDVKSSYSTNNWQDRNQHQTFD